MRKNFSGTETYHNIMLKINRKDLGKDKKRKLKEPLGEYSENNNEMIENMTLLSGMALVSFTFQNDF
ncbi:MAG: hypothetical protein GY750_07560 [Lentisphaerae bacterium]|nr:hypothetical protein [Lentisphaerota bacterium]MCP4101264.1 hypothetical protein [Lentisphaerota bacterium]